MSSFSRKIKTFLSLTIGISLLVSSVFLTNVFGQTLYPESTGSSTSADAQFYFYVKPNLNFDYYTNPVAYSGFNISIVDKTNNEIISKAVSDESGYASIKDSYEKYKGKIFDVLITKKNYLKRILSSVTFEPVTYFGRIENPVEMFAGDIEISGAQDNAINMVDVIQIAKCFGTARGDINYDLNCDLDMDKIISMTDVIAIAKHFGISGYLEFQPNYNTPTPKPTYTPTPTAWAHADSRPVSVEAESTIFGTYISYKGSYITDCDDSEYVIIPVSYGCGCGSAATINSFEVNAAVPDDKAGSMIEVRLGSKNGPLLGILTLKSTGGRQNYSVQKTDLQVITNYQSYNSIFLVFRGNNNIADFDKFSLLVSNKSTITPAPTTPTATTSTPTPVPTNPNNVVLKAVAYDDMSNIKNNGDTIICYNNSWIEFKNVDFNKWPIFPTDSIANLSAGVSIKNVPKNSFSYIEIRLDSLSGTIISAFKADSYQCPQDKLTAFYNSNEGKIYTSAHNVYVVFKSSSNEVCELDRISINFGVSSQHAPTPTPRLYTATPTPTYYNATPTIKPDNILELQTENYDEMSGVVNNGTSITCSDKSWIKFKNIDFSKLKKYAGNNYSNPLQIKTYGKVNYSNPFETLEVRLDSLYGPVIGKEMLSGWYTKYGTGLVIDGYLEYSLNIDNQYVDDLLANPHDIYIVYDAFNSQSLRTFDKLVFSY